MKLALWNLIEPVAEAAIRAELAPHVPESAVVGIRLTPDEDGVHAMAIIDLDIDAFAAGKLALELDGRWHAGSFLRAHVLNHA